MQWWHSYAYLPFTEPLIGLRCLRVVLLGGWVVLKKGLQKSWKSCNQYRACSLLGRREDMRTQVYTMVEAYHIYPYKIFTCIQDSVWTCTGLLPKWIIPLIPDLEASPYHPHIWVNYSLSPAKHPIYNLYSNFTFVILRGPSVPNPQFPKV